MKALLLFLCSLILSCGYTQTCSVLCKSSGFWEKSGNFEEEMAVFFSLEFSFNGVPLKTTSETQKIIPIHPNGFDTIRYSYTWNGKRIEAFSLCKFRKNEQYTISPCVCCGIFLMRPEKNPERGYVQFVNNSQTTYFGSASEIDTDSIPPNSNTPFQFASISMNCGFRPSQIAVFEPGYFDLKYTYENTSKLPDDEQTRLEAEQEKYIRYNTDFLFLHGERLILTIDKNARFTLKQE